MNPRYERSLATCQARAQGLLNLSVRIVRDQGRRPTWFYARVGGEIDGRSPSLLFGLWVEALCQFREGRVFNFLADANSGEMIKALIKMQANPMVLVPVFKQKGVPLFQPAHSRPFEIDRRRNSWG
jgi:hypothetical protein